MYIHLTSKNLLFVFISLLYCFVPALLCAAPAHPDIARLTTGFKQIKLAADNPQLCQGECVANTECKSFTFVKAGVNGPAALCVLKKEAPSNLKHDCCISEKRSEITQAHAESTLYKASLAAQSRLTTAASINGMHDTLKEYAKKCNDATGIPVPEFDCNDGREVPGQGDVPNGTACDFPNVLNHRCDPGSKFQVLPGSTADAVAVAHCRKVGLPVVSDTFNDIAVIQYNKKNGALCFYQALSNLPHHVPAPLTQGEASWPNSSAKWYTPAQTESIGCTGCHDNGGFIRSEYLAQLQPPGHVLPSTAQGFDNQTTPVQFVGLDFASNRNWSIKAVNAPGDSGLNCTTCHRLSVNNTALNGTGAVFANIATAATQASKNPHSASSPIWMRPGQITYNAKAEQSATVYQKCAIGFYNSGFKTPPAGCTITPLGVPYVAPVKTPPISSKQQCLNDCASERDGCMEDVSKPGGLLPKQCVQAFKACNARCK